MPLTDAKCRSARPGSKLQKLTDGGGLQLWMQPNRRPVMAVRLPLRRESRSCSRSASIPRFPWRGPARARGRKAAASDGLDPSVKRSATDAQAQATRPRSVALPMSIIAKLRREKPVRGDHCKIEWLLAFANAAFGDEPIGQIAAPAILKVLAVPSKPREL